jgi:hypothetical protein
MKNLQHKPLAGSGVKLANQNHHLSHLFINYTAMHRFELENSLDTGLVMGETSPIKLVLPFQPLA